jgi:hypothetical protein
VVAFQIWRRKITRWNPFAGLEIQREWAEMRFGAPVTAPHETILACQRNGPDFPVHPENGWPLAPTAVTPKTRSSAHTLIAARRRLVLYTQTTLLA